MKWSEPGSVSTLQAGSRSGSIWIRNTREKKPAHLILLTEVCGMKGLPGRFANEAEAGTNLHLSLIGVRGLCTRVAQVQGHCT